MKLYYKSTVLYALFDNVYFIDIAGLLEDGESSGTRTKKRKREEDTSVASSFTTIVVPSSSSSSSEISDRQREIQKYTELHSPHTESHRESSVK